MADMILGSAQGAVDSLLGRLSSALTEEAKLLGSVRGEVQFIKDEMESMNGFLLQVASTGDEEDHQVRAWMKQVVEVAYTSQNCIDHYVQSLGAGRREQGLVAYLRRLPQLLWTLPTRHRIATQIRELKIRACEVGERRLRYGVVAPTNNGRSHSSAINRMMPAIDDDVKEAEDAKRRALAEAHPPPPDYSGNMVKWLMEEGDHGGQQQVRVIALVGFGGSGKTRTAQIAFNHPLVATSFDSKVWVCVSPKPTPARLWREILAILADQEDHSYTDCTDEQLAEKIRQQLKGKRFLLVLDDVWDESIWNCIKSAFPDGNCAPPSAILVTTRIDAVADSFSPYQTMNLDDQDYSIEFYLDKAIALADNKIADTDLRPLLWSILARLVNAGPFCLRIFMLSLYANPSMTKENLQSLFDSLDSSPLNIFMKLLLFCYNLLPSNCKYCLLYLSIFPEDSIIRKTRLLRRLVAEGIITKRGRASALDEGDHCFNLLAAQGLVMPTNMDVFGRFKSFRMHDLIHEFVTYIAREDKFVKTSLPFDLAYRLSARNTVQLQQDENNLRSRACWNICNHFDKSSQTETNEPSATEMFLESLPSSPHLGLLEVLDLEDCEELKNHHLKSICNHVFQLKYLSLRSTGITELPKQLKKLQYLETLDIRQTTVKAFYKKILFLPKLKHLLAGNQADCTRQHSIQSKETIFTVQIPQHIGTMTELQVLSHVLVSGSGDELIDIGSLLRLSKLGVVLHGCKGPVLRHLYHAIGKLSKCLRSLSIEIIDGNDNADMNMNMEGELTMHPEHLQKLAISGLTNGLPQWVGKLDELTKITMHKTFLTDSDIDILGELTCLLCLRLRQDSCTESTLTFKKDAFQRLKFLVIECSEITSINFDNGTSPKLKKIIWSSTGTQSLSGIERLLGLQEINLTGNFNHERVHQAIAENKNKHIILNNNEYSDACHTCSLTSLHSS